jgi:hemerythrin-like domain-containing protein
MPALIDALRQEHESMWRLLEVLERQVQDDGVPDFDLVQEIVAYFLTYPDQYHHPKEDLIYRALRRCDPETAICLDDIEAEHEELGIATRELAKVSATAREAGRAPPGFTALLRAFVASYREHIRKEEQGFFPYALATLEPREWADLEAEVTDPTDPLLAETAAERLTGRRDRPAL